MLQHTLGISFFRLSSMDTPNSCAKAERNKTDLWPIKIQRDDSIEHLIFLSLTSLEYGHTSLSRNIYNIPMSFVALAGLFQHLDVSPA